MVSGSCTYNEETEKYETTDKCTKELTNLKKFGTAISSEILEGKTALIQGKEVTGSMKNNGAVSATINPGERYTIPEGYHNGSGKVTANNVAYTKAIVFTSSPVDMKQYTTNWASLITADFVVGTNNIKVNMYEASSTGLGWETSTSGGNLISYNATTGQLTFSYPMIRLYNTSARSDITASSIFVIYLGTVGGK